MHFSVGSNETQWRGTAGVNVAMSELGSLVLTAELMGLSTAQANALGNETWNRSRLARRYARTMIKKGKFMGDFVNVPSNGQWGTNLTNMPSNTSVGPLPAAGTGMGSDNMGGDTTIYYIDEGDSISTASVTNFEPLSIDEGLKNPNIMWS